MEVKRQLDVLDRNLAERRFLIGDDYSIADMAVYAWYGALVLHNIYDSAEFLQVHEYRNVVRWAQEIEERPAVKRGRRVNRTWGPEEKRVVERHGPEDFAEK
jgi:GST-like protein